MQEVCIKVHILKFIFEQSSTMKVPYPHDEEIIVAKWMILTRLSLSATRQHWWSSHHDSPNVNLRYPKYFRNFVEHFNCWHVWITKVELYRANLNGLLQLFSLLSLKNAFFQMQLYQASVPPTRKSAEAMLKTSQA